MIASVASMIEQFNMENIMILRKLGYSVHVACNFEQGSTIPSEKVIQLKKRLNQLGVRTVHIPIPRNPHHIKDLVQSFRMAKKMIECNHYDIIHCHSPIGGVIARLAARRLKGSWNKSYIYSTWISFF